MDIQLWVFVGLVTFVLFMAILRLDKRIDDLATRFDKRLDALSARADPVERQSLDRDSVVGPG